MAYIGREPVYGSLVTQSITPDGVTQTFALDYDVITASSVIVSVGGVVQKPDVAYNITNGGTQITFSEAPSSDVEVFLIYLSREILTISVSDSAITTAKLASNAVETSKIADGNVTTSKLADGSVITSKIADGNVTTSKIADSNITSSKLDSSLAISGTFTADVLTARNINITSNATVTGAYYESANVSATAMGANITLDANIGGFTYFTSSATANSTVNLVGVSSMPVNQAATFVVAVTNGATGYKVAAVQVEGTATGVTTKWQGGVAAPSGHASNVDIYSFTTVKTGASTYTVFASQGQFGP